MAWLRIHLTEEQQRVVNKERSNHPNPRVRKKMLALWLLHNGRTREDAAGITRISRATIQRYVAAFREYGLEGLRRWEPNRPVSEMASYRDQIRESLEKQPVRTVAEAAERIFELTGQRRGPTQVRRFLKDMGFRFLCVHPVRVPPQKTWSSTLRLWRLPTTPS
jgi:transposase